jgi:hypothetical protein
MSQIELERLMMKRGFCLIVGLLGFAAGANAQDIRFTTSAFDYARMRRSTAKW